MGFFADVGPLQVFVSQFVWIHIVHYFSQMIPPYLKFDANSNPPAYVGDAGLVNFLFFLNVSKEGSGETRLEKGESVRMRIIGTRVDATQIVSFIVF